MKYKLSDLFEGDYPISQPFGANPQNYQLYGLAGHEGIDYETPIGVNVYCPFESGIILRDVDDPKSGNYGNYIVIWDTVQKCAVWYCHLSSNLVSYGQKVTRGQVVGKTGNSGNSTGAHLHVNFVETDASGNRLNTGNGYQGFLNLFNYVEWITNSPQPPMTNDRRPYWFDRMNTVTFKTAWEKLKDQVIEKFVSDYPSQLERSGNWDKLAIKAGYTGDTNKLSVDDLYKLIEKDTTQYEKGKQDGIRQGRSEFKSEVISYITAID